MMNNSAHIQEICGCIACCLNQDLETQIKQNADRPSANANASTPLFLRRPWYKSTVTFGFLENVPEATRQNYRDAFSEIEQYTNLNYDETDYWSADSRIKIDAPRRSNWLAWASYPSGGDIGMSDRFMQDWQRGARRDTAFHEIGHSIGFAHTFEYKALLPEQFMDSRRYSVMAYNNRGKAKTFQALDIESFRAIYGTNLANTGNDTYVFTDMFGELIVDDGGFDTLDLSGLQQNKAQQIANKLIEGQDEHMLLNKSPNQWVSLLNTSVLEQAIMPNGQILALTEEAITSSAQGLIETGNIQNLTHRKQIIRFSAEFEEPIVFMGPITSNGNQPAIATVQSVNANSFETDIEEPLYLDNWHWPEATNYAIIEQGEFDDYSAGVLSIDDINKQIAMPDDLADFKYVFTQAQNQEAFYVTRQDTRRDILLIQTEEAYQKGKGNKPYEQIIESVDLAYFATDDLEIARSLGISQMQSINGGDTAWLRLDRNDNLYIAEEQSFDNETWHMEEIII